MVLGTEHRNVYQSMVPFALHNLNRLFQNITLSYEEKFKPFDCLVGSVLNYAAEVWGFHKGPEVVMGDTMASKFLSLKRT